MGCLSGVNVHLASAYARLHTGFQFAGSQSQAMDQRVVAGHSRNLPRPALALTFPNHRQSNALNTAESDNLCVPTASYTSRSARFSSRYRNILRCLVGHILRVAIGIWNTDADETTWLKKPVAFRQEPLGIIRIVEMLKKCSVTFVHQRAVLADSACSGVRGTEKDRNASTRHSLSHDARRHNALLTEGAPAPYQTAVRFP